MPPLDADWVQLGSEAVDIPSLICVLDALVVLLHRHPLLKAILVSTELASRKFGWLSHHNLQRETAFPPRAVPKDEFHVRLLM